MIRHALTTLRLTFGHWSWPLLALLQAFFVFLLCALPELEALGRVGWLTVMLSLVALVNALGTLHRDRVPALPALPLSRRGRALGETLGGLLLPVGLGLAALAWRDPGLLPGVVALLPSVLAVTLLRHLLPDLQSPPVALVPALALLLAVVQDLAWLAGPAAFVLVLALGPALTHRASRLRVPTPAGERHRAPPSALDRIVRGWFTGSATAGLMILPVWLVMVLVDRSMLLPGLAGAALVALAAGPHVRPAGVHPAAEGSWPDALELLPVPRRRLALQAWLAGLVASALLLVPMAAVGGSGKVYFLELLVAISLLAVSVTAWRMLDRPRAIWATVGAGVLYFVVAVGLPVGVVVAALQDDSWLELVAASAWIPLTIPLLAALSPLPRLLARRA